MNSLNLHFFYSSHIGHSFTNSSSCHDVERISCKFTESWILQSVVSPPLANSASPSCHKLSVALKFLRMPVSNALEHYSVTRTKYSYSAPDPLRTKLDPHPPHTRMHMTAGSCNPRRFIRPEQGASASVDPAYFVKFSSRLGISLR